jgi:integrase
MSERELTVWKATSEDGTPKTGSSCRIVDFNEDVMELLAAWARLWIEGGGNIYALSAQLGHSSVRVTTDSYGHFSRKASKLEAEEVRSRI